MATSIEHIFRSFVITKFREIQGQQFGGQLASESEASLNTGLFQSHLEGCGNAVSQHNGEINSPDRVNPSDDTIPSIGNLQNDPLVQKIEQVLSEVLSAESQYKPDGGENIVRTKSAKRGLSEEVQDEIPRKKSKKDKKHKDKKKKKRRKKEKKDKKYKKQSKDSKLNEKEDESGDLKYDVRSEPENSVAVLSAEDDVDTQLISPETQLPAWTQEKTAYENGNTAMSNSHGTDTDRNRSDMSKEHTTSVSIEDPAKVEVVNERELGNGPCQPTSVTSLLTEDEFLNIGNAVGSDLCVIRSRTSNMEQTEVSSVLETTEELNIAESGPHFLRGEQGYLKTSLESGMLEVKRLDLVTESLNSESTKPSASASSEMYLQPSVEAGAEGEDSVTTLGFLAKVVGKDFEATSELLNTTKVKASEITLKHIIDMKNAAIPDSERLVTTQDLQKALQLNSRAELKDLPSPESQHGVFEKSSKPISVMEPKLQQELKRTVESDAPKCTDVARDAETEPETKTLTETHVSGMIMELKESEKYPRHLQTIIDGKDIRRTQELQVTNRKDLASSVPDIAVKAVVAVRNIDPAPECEESVQMSCLAPSMEAVIKEKAMIEVDVPKTISQLEDVSEVRGLKTIPESADTMKPQNLEVSKCISVREVEHEAVVNLKDLKKGSDSPVTVKSAECTSESQYVKGILQSATVAQIKDVHASLELEGEKDIDASSDSLHMIFANYSEPNLELYAEPAVVLKNSKGVPESHVMVGAEIREEQHISKSKELTTVESEINDGLNNLHKNIECFHNNEKNVEAILESKVLPTGKHSDTLETVSKEGIMDTASHFEAGIEQNTPDTQEYMEKNQHDAEAADLHVLSRCQKVIKTGSKGRAENELFAGSESLLVTSESTQETNTLKSRMVPELKTIVATQELKEVVGFATRMGASSPEEKMEFQISESSGPKHFSTLISAIKQAESVAESGAEQNEESLLQTNTGIKKINLESTYDLDIKQMRASPAFLFSEDLKNQQEKQRLEERAEIAGMTTAPESPYDSSNDPVVVSESSTINKSVESEYHPASVHLGSINSENILKPLYSIQVKDTQTISESQFIDAKILETDSGATFQAGAEITGLREGELKAPSEIETVSETQKKNEMPHGLQTIPVSQESNETFRSKMPTLTNLNIHSEILCEFDTGNLELPSQCEELEIVKKSEGDKPSLSVADIVDRKVSSSFVCSTENEQLNAVKADETVGAVEKSKASTESADILEETFESTCMTDLKDLEGSQKLETHPESYIYTGSSTGTKDSTTLKNEARLISESVLEVTSKGEEECSRVDLEPGAKLVVKYSESVSDSVTVSEKVDDMSMTVFMVDVTDLEASSSCLDTRQTSNSETTIWIETTSTPICALLSRDSDGEVESVSKIETKDSGQAVSSVEALELKGAAASATQLNIIDLESSESISVAEVIRDLNTTPTCLDAVDLKISGTVAKAKALEVIDTETNLKPENASEVKLFETTLETETIIEKAAKLVSEKISNVEELKSISEPKHVEAAHSSEKQSQLQLHVEGKGSEITVESAHISDLMNTTVLMDTAPFAGGKSPKPNSLVDVKKSNDIEAANKCTFLQKVGDLPGVSSSTGEKLQTLESQELEQNSTSGLLLEKELSKISVESSHTVYTNDSEPVPESINAKSADIAEKSKCMSLTKVKDLEPTTEHTVLAKTKNSEMISQFTVKVSDPETMLGSLSTAKEKDLGGVPHISLDVQGLKTAVKPVCTAAENLEANQQVPPVLKDSGTALECVQLVEGDLKASEKACLEVKDLEPTVESMQKEKDKDLEATIEDSVNDQDSKGAPKSLDIMKEDEESTLKDKKSEKTSSKSKDKSKSGKKAKKSRSKSLSKSKKRKKKSRSRSVSRQVSARRARSRSKNDSDSRKKLSTSRHKSRSKSADRKGKESSLRSSRRHSRSPDRLKSRSKSVDRRETSVRSRRRRSRSSDHRKSRSRSVDRKESVRRRLSQSSDNHRSRSRSVDRRETLVRSRRRRSRSSDHRKSRSRSVDRRETSVRRRRRRSQSSDHCKSRSRSLDRKESSIRTRRRHSRSSDHHKSRSRSADDKRESLVRTRRRRSRSPETRKSRSRSFDRSTLRTRRRRSRSSDNRRSKSKSVDKRDSSVRTRRRRSRSSDNRRSKSKSVDKRETSVRTRRRRSRSSDNRRSKSKSVDKKETSVRTRRRRSRSSDNRRSKSKSVDKRETSVRTRRRQSRSSDNRRSKSKSVDKRDTSVRARRRQSRSSDNHRSRSKSIDRKETSTRSRRRRSVSSDRKSRSKSVDKRESSVRAKRRRSRSSDNRKSRSKSVENVESSRSKRRRSKSPDHKSGTKSDEKEELPLKSRSRRSKSSDRQVSRSKSRSKSSERKKVEDSTDGSRGKDSRYRSKSKSLENTERTESLEATVRNRSKSPEQHKSKSRSRSKSVSKIGEKESSRRSRSKSPKSPETRSHRRRTVSRSRRNRSHSLTRKRASRSKSDHRSRTRSLTRSRSRSRRWRRTRSRSVSRQRSLSRERRRRSRRNRSRSVDRRRRRSDSRDSYRISLRLRSRSRTPARLRCSRSLGRRRSPSKSPDHRRSRSSSRSPKRLTDLDKAQLLEIAKANAAAMCAKAGVPLPPSLMPVITPEKKEEKVTQKSAKETILELTEKCKKIAQSQEDDVIVNKPHVSDEEEEEHPFINHPFKLNEPKPIFFNLTTPTIKPAAAAPKNQVTLTKEFPVSSGSQHRKKEADSAYGEWVPVEKNKDEKKDDVFPNPANLEPVDISSALNERTIAQKRLTENTFDLEAMCLLNRAQERIDAWAELNSIPGHFTGSTGAQVLTSEQLSNSGPQAWVKKDQFLRAAPVRGGMGAQLMRKMGWREGEGLGKNKEGNKEPILVDFKTDRKGLVAIGEKMQKRHGLFSAVKDLSGKHPVSALLEVCNKRRWSPPVFVLVNDNRPEYRKNFLFKVMVNGVEYKPSLVSPNKKHAKATAATVALQALGLVPKDLLANATNFRSASHN